LWLDKLLHLLLDWKQLLLNSAELLLELVHLIFHHLFFPALLFEPLNHQLHFHPHLLSVLPLILYVPPVPLSTVALYHLANFIHDL
jgi:hypothetical protein